MATRSPFLIQAGLERALRKALRSVVTKTDLAGLAKKTDLSGLASRTDLAGLATKADVGKNSEILKVSIRDLNFNVTKQQGRIFDLISEKSQESADQHNAILEAVHELHGDRIRHTQEAIIELAKRLKAEGSEAVRKVLADLG